MSCEEEDTCTTMVNATASTVFGEEDTCMSYEEEDTCTTIVNATASTGWGQDLEESCVCMCRLHLRRVCLSVCTHARACDRERVSE